MAQPQMSLADLLLQSKGLAPIFKPPAPAGQLNLPQMPGQQMNVAPPPGLDLAQAAQPQGMMGKFVGALQRDPSLSLALMQSGLQMMQPHSKNTSHLGHLARSGQMGLGVYTQDQDRRQKKDLLDKESSRQDKMVGIAERGDARAQTRAEQETEQVDYERGQRPFKESIQRLQKEGLEVGLDVQKLQRDLVNEFGREEARAKLAGLLAQADYYKGGGKAGAAKIAGKVQEIADRTANYVAQGMDPVAAKRKAWADNDAANDNPWGGVTAATGELAMWGKLATDVTAPKEVQAFAQQQLLKAQQEPGGGAATPEPATGGGITSIEQLRAYYEQSALAQGHDPSTPEMKQWLDAQTASAWAEMNKGAQ